MEALIQTAIAQLLGHKLIDRLGEFDHISMAGGALREIVAHLVKVADKPAPHDPVSVKDVDIFHPYKINSTPFIMLCQAITTSGFVAYDIVNVGRYIYSDNCIVYKFRNEKIGVCIDLIGYESLRDLSEFTILFDYTINMLAYNFARGQLYTNSSNDVFSIMEDIKNKRLRASPFIWGTSPPLRVIQRTKRFMLEGYVMDADTRKLLDISRIFRPD